MERRGKCYLTNKPQSSTVAFRIIIIIIIIIIVFLGIFILSPSLPTSSLLSCPLVCSTVLFPWKYRITMALCANLKSISGELSCTTVQNSGISDYEYWLLSPRPTARVLSATSTTTHARDLFAKLLTAHARRTQGSGYEIAAKWKQGRGNIRLEPEWQRLMPADIRVNIKSRTKGPQAAGSFETKWPNIEINDFVVQDWVQEEMALHEYGKVCKEISKAFKFNLAPDCGNSCIPYMSSGAKEPSSRSEII